MSYNVKLKQQQSLIVTFVIVIQLFLPGVLSMALCQMSKRLLLHSQLKLSLIKYTRYFPVISHQIYAMQPKAHILIFECEEWTLPVLGTRFSRIDLRYFLFFY